MHAYAGRCHCGAIEVAFESAHAAADLPVRACGCGFCRSHGARTMTDAAGRASISADPARLNRYRFGLRTADFLICRDCGAYVGAYFEQDGQGYATLNVNCFEARDAFAREGVPTDYGAEDAAGRMARRMARWTPTGLIMREERR